MFLSNRFIANLKLEFLLNKYIRKLMFKIILFIRKSINKKLFAIFKVLNIAKSSCHFSSYKHLLKNRHELSAVPNILN